MVELPLYSASVLLRNPEKSANSVKFTRIKETIPKIVKTQLATDLLLHEKGNITSSADGTLVSYQDTMPHVGINWKLYRDCYERVPVIANAINNTADFALQAGFEFDASTDAKQKIEKFFDKHNFELILLDIFKQLQIYGNAYLELGDNLNSIKLLPPDNMFVVVEKGGDNDGEIKGYRQIITGKKDIGFEKDEIIHFKWNSATSPFYGVSDIRAVLGVLTKYMNWTEDLGEILHRYAAPIIHWQIGTPEFPASADNISDFEGSIENRQTGEDIITGGNINSTVVGTSAGMIQVDGLVQNLENQLIAGMRVPEIFVRGGRTSNKATADVELQAFDRKVKALQKSVGFMLEDFLFPKITPGKVKMVWNEFSVEGELARSQRLMNMTSAGIPLKSALGMIGWGSWIDDVEKAIKENPPTNFNPDEQKAVKLQKNVLRNPAKVKDAKNFDTDETKLISQQKATFRNPKVK